jgi:hypothetical protein
MKPIRSNDVRFRKEWKELYDRMRRVLQRFGEDNCAGGDYFVVDRIPITKEHVHMVQIHRLNMLRPEVIKTLQGVLFDHPEWKIEVFVLSPEEDTIISPEAGLLLCSDGIIDALDRSMLPKRYRDFVYEGSRPPPKGLNI